MDGLDYQNIPRQVLKYVPRYLRCLVMQSGPTPFSSSFFSSVSECAYMRLQDALSQAVGQGQRWVSQSCGKEGSKVEAIKRIGDIWIVEGSRGT